MRADARRRMRAGAVTPARAEGEREECCSRNANAKQGAAVTFFFLASP